MAAKKSGKKNPLNSRQRAFIRELTKGSAHKDAAIKAGYNPKNAKQSAHQALKGIQGKVPEIMDKMGLTDHSLIDQYLLPLLNAQETKFFVINKKLVTRNVQALGTRMTALENAFKLRGSYAPRDPAEAAQFGIKVVVIDVPRPPKFIDVGGNGHKPGDEDE